ncbi:MAG: hypothetical protein ABR899_09220 [Candidatus Krumholzibacteriaceae bacterium]|jgi:hypothetical protein
MNKKYGRITLGAAISLALVLCAQSSSAQEHPSARIYSLGGEHVSGVIPDLYTDITVNPANAAFADRLTLNYERRSIYGFASVFPYLNQNSSTNRFSTYRDSYMTNEVSVYGLGLSGWRAAVFAQWYLSQTEDNLPRYNYYSYSNALESDEEWSSADNDFARIDLIAAHALPDGYALGFRLQASGYYKSASNASGFVEDYYGDALFAQLDEMRKSTDATSLSGRLTNFDFQAGLTKKNGEGSQTELLLEASIRPLDYNRQNATLDISERYNGVGQMDGYDYARTKWSDARKGNLWTFGLSARQSFASGIRLYTGGSVSVASYHAQWSQFRQDYSWSGTDDILTGAFACNGSLRGANYFLKGGKKFGLRDNLDLYLGLHGWLEWAHAEEDPVVRYSQAHSDDTGSVVIDQPSSLEYTGTTANLYLPLSVEFRPSSYFSVFSGFTIFGGWHKYILTQPLQSLFSYSRPGGVALNGDVIVDAASAPVTVYPEENSTYWERVWSSGSTVTLGFSLHYRDRFFIDVYSGTEVIPSYLSGNMIDVRYVF